MSLSQIVRRIEEKKTKDGLRSGLPAFAISLSLLDAMFTTLGPF